MANKTNPLLCFVNISTTNRNFYKKIYTISHSYLRKSAKLCDIITTFVMPFELRKPHVLQSVNFAPALLTVAFFIKITKTAYSCKTVRSQRRQLICQINSLSIYR